MDQQAPSGSDASCGDHLGVIEISELAGGLAHEIRNPLSTLLLNLKLIDEDLSEGLDRSSDGVRRARQRVGFARQEAERLQRMLDEFLLIVGPVGLTMRRVDLNDVIHRLVQFYGPEAELHGVRIRADCAADAVWCRIDPNIFHQAVLNLMINAQQAMPDGGELLLQTVVRGGYAVLTVGDDGEGMSDAVRSRAFRAFYSTKPNGSGLGLSTTSRIVAAHQGRIELDTSVGRGTCFRIVLPLADASASG